MCYKTPNMVSTFHKHRLHLFIICFKTQNTVWTFLKHLLHFIIICFKPPNRVRTFSRHLLHVKVRSFRWWVPLHVFWPSISPMVHMVVCNGFLLLLMEQSGPPGGLVGWLTNLPTPGKDDIQNKDDWFGQGTRTYSGVRFFRGTVSYHKKLITSGGFGRHKSV